LPAVYIGSKFVVHSNGLLYIDNESLWRLVDPHTRYSSITHAKRRVRGSPP
jgi:hypothetical protein